MDSKDDKQLKELVTEDTSEKEVALIMEKFWTDNLMKTFIVFFGFGVSMYMYPSISGKICAFITIVPTCQLLHRGIKVFVDVLKVGKEQKRS